jgi:hypothetical protein
MIEFWLMIGIGVLYCPCCCPPYWGAAHATASRLIATNIWNRHVRVGSARSGLARRSKFADNNIGAKFRFVFWDVIINK